MKTSALALFWLLPAWVAAQTPSPVPGSLSPDGSCGGTNQFVCTGSTFGSCCSSGGWCGDSSAHCVVEAGCQPGFGNCTESSPISSDGICGTNGKICLGSEFGACCSASGFCGASSAHCAAGCQSDFGACTTMDSNVSKDGTCGKNGATCEGSGFGDCCSSSGFCGASPDHCNAGCQSDFGTCSETSDNISTDGTCATNGKTCLGSTFGDCCSSSGFCGSSSAHCNAGCQSGFGTCSEASSNISTDGKCGTNGKTCKDSTGFGECCSASGFCGSSIIHCGTNQGCQPLFGDCDVKEDSI